MDDQRPRSMAELFTLGEETIPAPRDAVRAGLVGLLTLLTTVIALVAAVVVTVAFFVTVLGGISLIFGLAPPPR
ncbi:hypothetical protein [Curtobacterium sp. MCPF17_031]|uniref:hypothetical protein n=1 Tax=Curtobacterium sp. MCPF17_031 TaxID=2175653 RepID=UPI000DA9425F|nr:hypothetical protein [Curtobacterium sp. MCPF17_031]PZE33904.1 hypothetical protein DEJ31_15795 [Curtobacterium sp. MCPF17_031]